MLTDLILYLARKAQNVLRWNWSNRVLHRFERWPIAEHEPDVRWSLSASESAPYPPLQTRAFKNATLFTPSGIVLAHGRVVPDTLKLLSTQKANPHEFHRIGFRTVKLDGAVASMDMVWSNNYFHMLLDGLFALHALRSVPDEVPLTVVTRLNLPPVMVAAFQEWLPNRPLIQLRNTARVIAPLVVAPSRRDLLYKDGLSIRGLAALPTSVRAFLRQYGKGSQLPEAVQSAPRLFIGRKGTKWRRMLNESDVEALLERRGFISIQIQRFTNAEQFEMFRRATAIVAVRGASVANLLAIERPLKFISLRPTPDDDGAETLEAFIRLGEIEYGEVGGDGENKSSDFRIDLTALEAELDRLDLH